MGLSWMVPLRSTAIFNNFRYELISFAHPLLPVGVTQTCFRWCMWCIRYRLATWRFHTTLRHAGIVELVAECSCRKTVILHLLASCACGVLQHTAWTAYISRLQIGFCLVESLVDTNRAAEARLGHEKETVATRQSSYIMKVFFFCRICTDVTHQDSGLGC